MEEECVVFSDSELNVVMMDGCSKILIVVVLDVSMILFQSLIWIGIIDFLKNKNYLSS
jgi:hypothetical protein